MISIVTNVLFSSYKQEDNSIHGVKIREEANVLGNAKNTDENNCIRRIIRNRPRYVHLGEKLNSQCLNTTSLINVRHYYTIKEEPELSMVEVKRLLTENGV